MAVNMATQTQVSGEEGSSRAATKPTPPAPEEIASHFPSFEILECLGRGGMGIVYKARQKSLNRLVALKILAPEREKDAAFGKRFVLEAETLAKLNHSGIITIYDFGQTDGLFYLVMEFVDGVTLRRLLETGRLAAHEALAIVPQICDALQYAHDQGIIHRDIKPENILLDRRGRVKVADFGLAKLVEDVEETVAGKSSVTVASSLTGVGRVMGTPSYMAPEQARHPAEVDHRADIYALGVVFYQMLTGELPDRQLQPPSKKVRIDVRLDEVVLLALERDPERRYQHASEVKTAVETIARSSQDLAEAGAHRTNHQKTATGEQPTAIASRHGQPAWLYAFAAGILTVLLVEFALSAATMESGAVALALGLPAGGVALVILLLARKHWLGSFLTCVAFVFLLCLAMAGFLEGPWLLGLTSGVAALATFTWLISRGHFPAGFLRVFLTVHFIVFGASAFVTAIMPESFVSTARVSIQRTSAQPPPTELTPRTSGYYDPWFIQTEFEVIQSEVVLGKVIRELDLADTWGKRYGRGQVLKPQEALGLLKRSLDLRPVRNANLIEIRVFSDLSEEAATIANKIAEDYQQYELHAGTPGEPGLARVTVEIIDTARPGLRPVRPNKPMNLAIGALAGLLIGTIAGNAAAGRHDKRRTAVAVS